MAIRIPSNQIVTSKYTSGGEFIVELTNAAYQGYYYELNNNLYAGKTFDIKSPKLIKIKDRNTLLNRGLSTAIFSLVSGITSKTLSTPKITSLSNGINDLYIKPEGIPKFYCKKLNNQPILIKEISEDDFNILQSNPIYQTLRIDFKSQNYLEQAEKQMPGITTFLLG